MQAYRFFILALTFAGSTLAQNRQQSPPQVPRLVVGLVVDQMRNDYLYRYWDRYGQGGFKRLVSGGFHFKNAHYNYIPTYTGPGHCSVYTGTTPRTHGIIGNDWYQRETGRSQYCVEDSTVQSVGSDHLATGVSPRHQLTSTVGDELKLSSSQQGKVFSIALKDRSAVLPAGHAANGAFWFDDASGHFVSSTWYMQQLPAWLNAFNARSLPREYLGRGWQTLYPLASYTASIADNNPYEEAPDKTANPVFPYDYSRFVSEKKYGLVKHTPWGNTLTKDLAIACLQNEALGKDSSPDLLCLSFSTPDLVGHAYGPRAVEVEDIYLRLDRDLESLLAALDQQVGKGNYTVFLTADHGGADVPAHLNALQIPAGRVNERQIGQALKKHLNSTWGDSTLFLSFSNEQVFLHRDRLQALKLDPARVTQELSAFLLTLPGIAEAYTAEILKTGSFANGDLRTLLQNGYNHRLSGDVAVVYAPGWMDHGPKGTTHGSGYAYDTHVPIVFYGAGVKPGHSWNYTTITQIAPTVCELLRISHPSAATAEPLNGFWK